MNLTNKRDRILAAIGAGALFAYILACTGASFSPDDSKVLFPANDLSTGRFTVVLYDRRTGTSRTLFAVPADDAIVNGTGWTQDGSRAVAIWTANGDINIASIPLDNSRPLRLFRTASGQGGDEQFWYSSPAVIGSSLFVGVAGAIHRFDLEYGREAAVPVEGDLILFGRQNHLYYAREIAATGEQAEQLEFGLVNQNSLALSPLYAMPWSERLGMFTLSRDGSQLAVMVNARQEPEKPDEDSRLQIGIYENGRLLRTLSLGDEMRAAGIFTPDLTWSGDSKHLYFSYRKRLDPETLEYGVAGLAVADGSLRTLPLLKIAGKNSGGDDYGLVTGLSHDGRTFVAASTYLETSRNELTSGQPQRLKPQDLALYLIDLSTPAWKTTRVPIPPLPLPPATRPAQLSQ